MCEERCSFLTLQLTLHVPISKRSRPWLKKKRTGQSTTWRHWYQCHSWSQTYRLLLYLFRLWFWVSDVRNRGTEQNRDGMPCNFRVRLLPYMDMTLPKMERCLVKASEPNKRTCLIPYSGHTLSGPTRLIQEPLQRAVSNSLTIVLLTFSPLWPSCHNSIRICHVWKTVSSWPRRPLD